MMYQNTLIWATANANDEENVKATKENLLEKRLFIIDFTQSFSLNKDILNRFYLSSSKMVLPQQGGAW